MCVTRTNNPTGTNARVYIVHTRTLYIGGYNSAAVSLYLVQRMPSDLVFKKESLNKTNLIGVRRHQTAGSQDTFIF